MQGHKIEQRWFSVISGSFRIQLIEINNWENLSKKYKKISYILNAQKFDVLHVPQVFASSIQALTEKSKLLVMGNYHLGDTNDEYKYNQKYFEV